MNKVNDVYNRYSKQNIVTILQKYTMHIFGFVAFILIGTLSCLALYKYALSRGENLAVYLPYGIVIFILNLFYIKAIRLSREDYEDKLKIEKEYSQKLLDSQKRFLRYAVHETNTPLAVIVANIELFEMEHGKHSALQNIDAATKNISSIYDDLSYLTQKDKLDYPESEIPFCVFVESRVQFFDIVANQSNVHFEMIDESNNSNIYFNETKLQRIVDNNITNAIKYTYDDELITIILKNIGEHHVFEISSHSRPIKDTEHIFDAYYREDDVEDGLGLGLNLVKNICYKESVSISVDSCESKTTFCYRFLKRH